jgi:hypothetical protein
MPPHSAVYAQMRDQVCEMVRIQNSLPPAAVIGY